MNLLNLIATYLHPQAHEDQQIQRHDTFSKHPIQKRKSWHHSEKYNSQQISTQQVCDYALKKLFNEMEFFTKSTASNSLADLSDKKISAITTRIHTSLLNAAAVLKTSTTLELFYPCVQILRTKEYKQLKEYRIIFDWILKPLFAQERKEIKPTREMSCITILDDYTLYKTMDSALEDVSNEKKRLIFALGSKISHLYPTGTPTSSAPLEPTEGSLLPSERECAISHFESFTKKQYSEENVHCLEQINIYKQLVTKQQEKISEAVNYLLSVEISQKAREDLMRLGKQIGSHEIDKIFFAEHKERIRKYGKDKEDAHFIQLWKELQDNHLAIITKLYYIYENFFKNDAPEDLNTSFEFKKEAKQKINPRFDIDLFDTLTDALRGDLQDNFMGNSIRAFSKSQEFQKMVKELGIQ